MRQIYLIILGFITFFVSCVDPQLPTSYTVNVSYEMEEALINLNKNHYNNARLNYNNVINYGSATETQKSAAYAGLGWVDATEYENFSYGLVNFEMGRRDVNGKVGLILGYLSSIGVREQELNTTSTALVTSGISLFQEVYPNSEYQYYCQYSTVISDAYLHAIFAWFLYLDDQVSNSRIQLEKAWRDGSTDNNVRLIKDTLQTLGVSIN